MSKKIEKMIFKQFENIDRCFEKLYTNTSSLNELMEYCLKNQYGNANKINNNIYRLNKFLNMIEVSQRDNKSFKCQCALLFDKK